MRYLLRFAFASVLAICSLVGVQRLQAQNWNIQPALEVTNDTLRIHLRAQVIFGDSMHIGQSNFLIPMDPALFALDSISNVVAGPKFEFTGAPLTSPYGGLGNAVDVDSTFLFGVNYISVSVNPNTNVMPVVGPFDPTGLGINIAVGPLDWDTIVSFDVPIEGCPGIDFTTFVETGLAQGQINGYYGILVPPLNQPIRLKDGSAVPATPSPVNAVEFNVDNPVSNTVLLATVSELTAARILPGDVQFASVCEGDSLQVVLFGPDADDANYTHNYFNWTGTGFTPADFAPTTVSFTGDGSGAPNDTVSIVFDPANFPPGFGYRGTFISTFDDGICLFNDTTYIDSSAFPGSPVTIQVNGKPEIGDLSDTTSCGGDTIQLFVESSNSFGLDSAFAFPFTDALSPDLGNSVTGAVDVGLDTLDVAVFNPLDQSGFLIIGQTTFGCTDSDTVRLNDFVQPVVDLGPDTAYSCNGDSVLVQNDSVTGAGAVYTWNTSVIAGGTPPNGAGGFPGLGGLLDPTDSVRNVAIGGGIPSDTLQVRFEISAGGGCSDSDSVIVVFAPLPQILFTPFDLADTASCNGDPLVISFDSTNANAVLNNPFSVVWAENNISGTPFGISPVTGSDTAYITGALTPGDASSVEVLITDDVTGCSDSDSIQVFYAAPIAASILDPADGDTASCGGLDVVLGGSNDPGYLSGPLGRRWDLVDATFIDFFFNPGLITTSDTDSVTVEMIMAGSGFQDSVVYTTTDTNYCTASDTVVVFEVDPIDVSLGNDTVTCNGGDITLTATFASPFTSGALDPAFTPVWGQVGAPNTATLSPGTADTNQVVGGLLTTGESDTIYILVRDTNFCTDSAAVGVTTVDGPVVDLLGSTGIDTVICFGDSILLNIDSLGSDIFNWGISAGGAGVAQFTSPGAPADTFAFVNASLPVAGGEIDTITLEVINSGTGCRDSDTVAVTFVEEIDPALGIVDTFACDATTLALSGPVYVSGGVYTGPVPNLADLYSWFATEVPAVLVDLGPVNPNAQITLSPTPLANDTDTAVFVVELDFGTVGSCADSDSVQVIAFATPIVDDFPDQVICGVGDTTVAIGPSIIGVVDSFAHELGDVFSPGPPVAADNVLFSADPGQTATDTFPRLVSVVSPGTDTLLYVAINGKDFVSGPVGGCRDTDTVQVQVLDNPDARLFFPRTNLDPALPTITLDLTGIGGVVNNEVSVDSFCIGNQDSIGRFPIEAGFNYEWLVIDGTPTSLVVGPAPDTSLLRFTIPAVDSVFGWLSVGIDGTTCVDTDTFMVKTLPAPVYTPITDTTLCYQQPTFLDPQGAAGTSVTWAEVLGPAEPTPFFVAGDSAVYNPGDPFYSGAPSLSEVQYVVTEPVNNCSDTDTVQITYLDNPFVVNMRVALEQALLPPGSPNMVGNPALLNTIFEFDGAGTLNHVPLPGIPNFYSPADGGDTIQQLVPGISAPNAPNPAVDVALVEVWEISGPTLVDSAWVWVLEDYNGTNVVDYASGNRAGIGLPLLGAHFCKHNSGPGITLGPDYVVVVRHRNHLPIALNAAEQFQFTGPGPGGNTVAGGFADMRDPAKLATGLGGYQGFRVENVPGLGATALMVAGNVFDALPFDAGEVNATDYFLIRSDNGLVSEYTYTDITLDGDVNSSDQQLAEQNNNKLFNVTLGTIPY